MTVAQVDAAFIRMTGDLRARVLGLLDRQFQATPDFWQANEDAFVRATVPLIVGAQQTTATITDAWLRARLFEQTGKRIPAKVDLAPISRGLRGVPPADLYRRPFEQTRYHWSKGATITAAAAAGALRLRQLAGTDLELAHTMTAADFIDRTDPSLVPGFNRVTTSREPCPLCVEASDWHYYRGDLLPIHDNCRCIVVPSLVAPSRTTKVAAADGSLSPLEEKSLATLLARQSELVA